RAGERRRTGDRCDLRRRGGPRDQPARRQRRRRDRHRRHRRGDRQRGLSRHREADTGSADHARQAAGGLIHGRSRGAARVPVSRWRRPGLTYVSYSHKLTYMEKVQVYLAKEELAALRKAAARSGRSVADLVRDSVRKVVLKPQSSGLVAIWDGE